MAPFREGSQGGVPHLQNNAFCVPACIEKNAGRKKEALFVTPKEPARYEQLPFPHTSAKGQNPYGAALPPPRAWVTENEDRAGRSFSSTRENTNSPLAHGVQREVRPVAQGNDRDSGPARVVPFLQRQASGERRTAPVLIRRAFPGKILRVLQ